MSKFYNGVQVDKPCRNMIGDLDVEEATLGWRTVCWARASRTSCYICVWYGALLAGYVRHAWLGSDIVSHPEVLPLFSLGVDPW